MRTDEFKRRLRQLIREELKRTDLKALIHEAIANTDLRALVFEALHDKHYMASSSTGPVQQRVLH